MPVHAAPLLDGAMLSWSWSLPFIGLLLTIAIGPLAFPRIWSRHYGKIAACWSALALLSIAFTFGALTALDAFLRAMLLDYMSFIALLFSLYVVAGGILVTGNLHGTPAGNAGMLLLGTVLARPILDFTSFKQTVDAYPDQVTPITGDLAELCEKIRGSFASGLAEVLTTFRNLREELIHRHVLDGAPLDPYFSVLDNVLNALQSDPRKTGPISGNWAAAVHHAIDCVRIDDWSKVPHRQKRYARQFELAAAAKRLRDRGYEIIRQGHYISLELTAETRLVARLEKIVVAMGGLNICRRLFQEITRWYDPVRERYHVVNHPTPTGEGRPEPPLGYLVLLAAKHLLEGRAKADGDANWAELRLLSMDYAAIFDVREYTHVWRGFDAHALIPYLRNLALYDTLFRLPQVRGSDIEKIARGLFARLDLDEPRGGGWTINQVLEVEHAILVRAIGTRGPARINLHDLAALCPSVGREMINTIMTEVLCHPRAGANQNFAKPTDAPTDEPSGKTRGHDFYMRPLLSRDGKSFWLVDRSLCAWSFIEALLARLRAKDKNLDSSLGETIEAFVQGELTSHGVPFLTGDYDVDGKHGECDLVVETTDTILFLELKKKPLTRRARAGSDVHIVLDLANSLLDAQVQSGWHEAWLRKHNYLDLTSPKGTARLELKGRSVERIALSLLEFGSFQDRTLLKQFLEASMPVAFDVKDAALESKFEKLNATLRELREQLVALNPGESRVDQPFSHCWFLSVSQLLAALDGVSDAQGLKDAIWKTRNFITGSSDFYYDNALLRGWKVGN